MKRILKLIGWWTLAWVIVATILGVALMLGKTPIMAESGGAPDDVREYVFWIPTAAAIGLVGGLSVGAIYALLMHFVARWSAPSISARSMICGAVAPVVVGAWVPETLLLLVPAGVLTGWWMRRFIVAATPATSG